jgi:aspartyl-tRNA(Asn)/glutamyl-tRNA(Gln) amidotransferase subunit A
MPDIIDLTLVELVDKIRKKEISSKEVTAAYVDRSQKSKKLNTYVTEDFEIALKKLIILIKIQIMKKNYLEYQ